MPSITDTLQAHFSSANSPRPILTSLNGDSSWLISLPRPPTDRARKTYFHIVSDPWLSGPANLHHPWFLQITTPAPPAISSGSAVSSVIAEIETVANPSSKSHESSPDAIFVNFHYLDHLHEATLRTFDPAIPVFAAPEAAAIAKTWNHFTNITLTQDLLPGKNSADLHPDGLPGWLNVFRLPGHHELNFATAIVYSALGESEAILHSPHGIRTDQPSLGVFTKEEIKVLAILHALKDGYAFGMATTLGIKGGKALEEVTKPKYWVKSHDAPLRYRGIIAWVGWISDVFQEEDGVVEVGNGECFVLE
ncbi:hypothetical protein OQA88_12559 [Cercophora sp. LCS_1]